MNGVESEIEIGYKIKSKKEGVERLRVLAKKIDDLIAIEDHVMPEGIHIHVITHPELIKKHIHQDARYIKFGLICHLGVLPEE